MKTVVEKQNLEGKEEFDADEVLLYYGEGRYDFVYASKKGTGIEIRSPGLQGMVIEPRGSGTIRVRRVLDKG